MSQLYPPLWEGLNTALRDIFAGGFLADRVIQRQLKFNRKWGSRDRRLFAEAVYDIVRWWRKLLFVVDVPWPSKDCWEGAPPEVMARVIEAWCGLHAVELGKGIRRQGLQIETLQNLWNDASIPRPVRQSIPDWLDAWAFEQLEDRWDPVLDALNKIAPVYLRANSLKISAEKLVSNLRSENIQAQTVKDDAIILNKRANVFLSKSFRAGHFEVQDLHSQQVANLLAPQPGERVVDACAGAGGKSLHLAALMKNKGHIISMDVAENKLQRLKERATRGGATCIEDRIIDSSNVITRLEESADRLLLDVPCSGLGVLRRNPDSKWRLSLKEVQRLKTLQADILSRYSRICKPGGIMVYATCSIMPEENERQVENFLSQNAMEWKLESQHTLWPESDGADGFFAARIKRL